ncbi:MAG: hypothetical protein IPM47_20580 [Sphingobacteriales bacterium]|nr:MAG: hypothetical protein IPM47_20580 [Sphingobacteriales bacterium]
MYRKLFFPFIILFILAFHAACYYDNEEELYPDNGQPNNCDTITVTYSGTILPLLQSKCYVCHSSAAALGGIILEDYANARQYSLNGKMYGAVSHSTGFSPMPQGGAKLPVCDIAAIKKWTDDGAPNN